MIITRTSVVRIAAVLIPVIAAPVFAQQDFPNRPVRIIVPFPPGGSTDPMARLTAAKLSERWGVSVVVDNRPGAQTTIGNSIVAKSAPDGYTYAWGGPSLMTGPSINPNLPYDVFRDFTAVTTAVRQRNMLVVHPSVPVNTLKELIDLAKAQPGKVTYGSSGVGTNVHLSGAWFADATGINILHVPYRGSGPLITDLIAGRINISFQVPVSVMTYVQGGKLRPIAISGDTRLPALPNVPTYAEVGMPGFGLVSWSFLAGPGGLPMAIQERVARDMAVILAQRDTIDVLAAQGAEPVIHNPQQTQEMFKREVAQYAKIIKMAGITFTP